MNRVFLIFVFFALAIIFLGAIFLASSAQKSNFGNISANIPKQPPRQYQFVASPKSELRQLEERNATLSAQPYPAESPSVSPNPSGSFVPASEGVPFTPTSP